ncbi:hypothetical protein FM038_012190 [Shewanella eurypsychrophilus]|uniref:Orphan protein n=1 Tax=Shewanella eurypsychrophilus TaxID=2593656 RepID=A0ABX6V655_9GAMM|nr:MULTISPECIES: hypothetical protein [Shewanella]QFU22829.1 hypothetical protein FS418_13770 [Shewanella sp. YLB-09]QPG58116.1 hypothetical protein FM038_012190 [Shewanella eurypsychrophilus]
MPKSVELPKEKKITVLCRIEPGCLGPKGLDHIEDFCRFANQELKRVDGNFIIWLPLPRYDKSLAEMQYSVNKKQLNHDKAAQYLAHFDCDLDDFEEHFHEQLSVMIDEFLSKITT